MSARRLERSQSRTQVLQPGSARKAALSAELEAWKAKAIGTCFDIGDAKNLFRGVTAFNGKIRFSCDASPSLCACLTRAGSRKEKVMFQTSKSSLMLLGDGEYVSYNIKHLGSGNQRRRLLRFRGRGGS